MEQKWHLAQEWVLRCYVGQEAKSYNKKAVLSQGELRDDCKFRYVSNFRTDQTAAVGVG